MGFLFDKRIETLGKKIVLDFKKMIQVYLNAYPHSEVEFKRSYTVSIATYFKAWIGVLYLFLYRKSHSRLFFFQSLRNHHLLDLLPPSQISIVGGNPEKQKSLIRGYGFLWTGGIVAAILIAAKAKRITALHFQISFFLRKFRESAAYFFLIEDTLPVGSFFATLGNAASCPTILLQHGYITGTEILIDGQQCAFTVLYSKEQEKFIKNSKAVSFELGPAMDIVNSAVVSNEVILVGTGGKGYTPELYYKALEVYSKISEDLLAEGISVLYRPHPNEDPADYKTKFSKIDLLPVKECLSQGKKIFIGYVSTLLYEAKFFGHGIIAVTDPNEPSLAHAPHFTIDADNIGSPNKIVAQLQLQLKDKTVTEVKPLIERFLFIFHSIQEIHKNRS